MNLPCYDKESIWGDAFYHFKTLTIMAYRSILPLVFCFFFVISLYSQNRDSLEWAPLGATWYYEAGNSVSQAKKCLVMESVKDTLVMGMPSSVLQGYVLEVNGDTTLAGQYTFNDRMVIHQRGDSVFYLRGNQFELLYDFSLDAGDTMNIVTPLPYDPDGHHPDTMIQVIIESVGEIVVDHDTLRTQEIKINQDAFNSNFWMDGLNIEKIGNTSFLLPVHSLFCDVFCPIPLRCYQDDDIFYKTVDITCDSTWVVSSTNPRSALPNILLYPNPLYPGSTMHLEGIKVEEWWVTDVQGRLIIKGESIQGFLSIDIPSIIKPGMYFVRMRSDHDVYIRKILVR